MKRDRNRNRSDIYQDKFCEILIGDPSLFETSNPPFNLESSNEDIERVREQLMIRVIQIARKELSEKNYDVLRLYLDGNTQEEIAKEVALRQPAISKRLGARRPGEIIAQLKESCLQDDVIRDLLEEIEEVF